MTVRRRATALVATAALTGAPLTACGSDQQAAPEAAASPSPSPRESPAPACPAAPEGTDMFPVGLPTDFPPDFPPPPGASGAVADAEDPEVVAIRFPSTAPLLTSVEFVLQRLPAAGFTIVGGDQEPHEADVVFARGELRGQLRIARVDDCTTFWLVQVKRPGAPG